MPSVLQLDHMTYDDVAETIFLGGTILTGQTSHGFVTAAGGYTVEFSGKHLTFDDDGNLTGGNLQEYRVYKGTPSLDTQQIVVGARFVTLAAGGLTEAFALAASGDLDAATRIVTTGWQDEHFAQRNYTTDDLHGYRSDDYLFAATGGGTISGLGGNDTILAGSLGGLALGGDGNDSLYGNAGEDTLKGGNGDDTLMNNRGPHSTSRDFMYGGAGNDTIISVHGRDYAYGGLGDDRIDSDFTVAGAGNDLCTGTRADSDIRGGNGNDTIYGNGGHDYLLGEDGNDAIYGGGAKDYVFGRDGNDTLYGGDGNDLVDGDDGNDHLYAGDGNDLVFGDAGNDTFYGSRGTDTLSGGDGSDTFRFHATKGQDTITDFTQGTDTIWLKEFHFASFAAVQALISDGADGAVIHFSATQDLILQGVTAADLQASDFIL